MGHQTKPGPNPILLHSVAQKRIYPIQCLPTYAIAQQFVLKNLVQWGIECFLKIQYDCINLSSIVQSFSPIIYYSSQLSFTTVPFSECMLSVWEKYIFIQMSHDIWVHYVFEKLAKYTSQRNGTVTCESSVIPFIEKTYICKKKQHSLGILPVSRDCLKRWAKTGSYSVVSSFRTLWWSSSGPKALEGFKSFKKVSLQPLLKQHCHPWKVPIYWEMGSHYVHFCWTHP